MGYDFIGQVLLFAGTYAPRDWAECDGQMLPIAEHQALFSILGVTYGGDGRTTFALPKLEAPATGLRYIICMEGIYPPRS